MYHLLTLRTLLGVDGGGGCDQQEEKSRIIYARVSSSHQKKAGDLQRQIDDLAQVYPEHEVISDVGSGLNYKRRGFKAILDRVHQGMVDEVVVRHKDRLCRYGLELVEWILEKAGTRLVVLSQSADQEPDATRELADDLLAITTVFVARHNGQRSAENRRRRKRARQECEAANGDESTQSAGLPNQSTSDSAQQVVRDSKMDVQPDSGVHSQKDLQAQQEGVESTCAQQGLSEGNSN